MSDPYGINLVKSTRKEKIVTIIVLIILVAVPTIYYILQINTLRYPNMDSNWKTVESTWEGY